jgi:hypothetical protein
MTASHCRIPDDFFVSPEERAQLADLFRSLMTTGVPRPIRQPDPIPPPRIWTPTSPPVSASKLVMKRHPAFTWAFYDAPEMIVRQVVRNLNQGRFHKFASRKMGRMVRARSSLEYDHCRQLEIDSGVEAYCEHPIVLRYWFRGGMRHYIPDSFVRASVADEFREVKPERVMAKPENEEKYAAIGAAISALGYRYRVVTDAEIRRWPSYENVKTLFAYRHSTVPSRCILDLLEQQLSRITPLPVRRLLELAPDISDATIYGLILRNFLRTDLEQPLGAESPIWLTGRSPTG